MPRYYIRHKSAISFSYRWLEFCIVTNRIILVQWKILLTFGKIKGSTKLHPWIIIKLSEIIVSTGSLGDSRHYQYLMPALRTFNLSRVNYRFARVNKDFDICITTYNWCNLLILTILCYKTRVPKTACFALELRTCDDMLTGRERWNLRESVPTHAQMILKKTRDYF